MISLSLAAESSESFLFSKLNEYKDDFSSLISHRQYNDRRKFTTGLCNQVRERIAFNVDGGEYIFCIDSMPIKVCRPIRSKRCKIGKNNYDKTPNYGYCASQGKHYCGYKLRSPCGLSGVIHSFGLTKVSVRDIHYLKDIKYNFQNCAIIGDRGYIGASIQLDLFEKVNIKLEVHIGRMKKIGNLYLVHLLKQEKGLKRFLHNYVINL